MHACFGMSLTEASMCDPQQRLLMQVSWESMQSTVCKSSGMGVYVGIEHMEYNGLMK